MKYYAKDEYNNTYSTMLTNGNIDTNIWMYHKWMHPRYDENIEIYDGRFDAVL